MKKRKRKHKHKSKPVDDEIEFPSEDLSWLNDPIFDLEFPTLADVLGGIPTFDEILDGKPIPDEEDEEVF